MVAKHMSHFQEYWICVIPLDESQASRKWLPVWHLPGGLSKGKLIWVPGQIGASLQGRKSPGLWEAFDQHEILLREEYGEEMFVRHLTDGWAARRLDGIRRNSSTPSSPPQINFPTHMAGLGYFPAAWLTGLCVSWFLNQRGVHAETRITFNILIYLEI